MRGGSYGFVIICARCYAYGLVIIGAEIASGTLSERGVICIKSHVIYGKGAGRYMRKILLFVLIISVLTGCASTYYTDLPSRQPSVYTDSSFSKDDLVKKESERAKEEFVSGGESPDFESSFERSGQGTLKFRNIIYPEDEANGQKSDSAEVAGGITDFNESEAIIEALSERLSYYEGLQEKNGEGGDFSGVEDKAVIGTEEFEERENNSSKKSPSDLVSENLNGSMITVSGRHNFVNSSTVYSYVKGKVYEAYYHPQHATSIKLQEGETLSFAALGDTTNWTIETLENAEEDGVYTYILLRPYAIGETDLHLYTDRRVYHFRLISTEKAYQVQIEFRYPESESMVTKPKKAGAAGKGNSASYDSATSFSKGVKDLNFNYRITGNASWKPLRAYSDTERTYIQFANSFVTNTETPIVLLRHNGRDEIVDFTGRGITYIVPVILSTNEIFVLKVGREECYVGY